MKKQLLTVLLALIAVCCLTLGLSACALIEGKHNDHQINFPQHDGDKTADKDNQHDGDDGCDNSHIHAYGDWEVVTPATCKAAGEEKRVCSCGETQTKTINVLSHTAVIDEAVAATCTDVGKTEGKHCPDCGTVLVAQEVIPAKGHTEVFDYAVSATCTKEGKTQGKHCKDCGTILIAQQIIPAKGHIEAIDHAVAPTCATYGKTEGKHCQNCGTVLVAQQLIPMNEHIEVIDNAVAPTCKTYGKTEGKHCLICGEITVAQQAIPFGDHTAVIDRAVLPTCTKEGKTEGSHCRYCGIVLVAQQPIPTSHVYSDIWKYSETQHWQECIGCDNKTNLENHDSDYVCSVCGRIVATTQSLVYALNADNQSYSVTGLLSVDANIVIPSEYEGLPVTGIGDRAFYGLSIASIIIPDSITSIGKSAFSQCHGLTSLKIGKGLTTIKDSAFFRCIKLESITVADDNTTYHSVNNCLINTAEKTLVLGCKNSIIPSDGSVTNIGKSAFAGCANLTDIVIPNSVTSIGREAFVGCHSLTSLTIGNGVTKIDVLAFKACIELTSVVIPDSVTSIGGHAFFNCPKLASITIGKGLTYVHPSAFGEATFDETPRRVIESITVSEDNTTYRVINNCLINIKEKTLVLAYNTESCVIPSDGSVTSIGDKAFCGCNKLTSLIIPEGVTSIGKSAFSYCSELSDLVIPDSVTKIDNAAFWGCGKLTGNITIPDGMTYVGQDIFWYCSELTSVTIPASVTLIRDGAFLGCTGLTDIYYKGTIEQWNAIKKIIILSPLFPPQFTVHCLDGDVEWIYHAHAV